MSLPNGKLGVQGAEPPPPDSIKNQKGWALIWIAPGIWLALVALSLRFRGGEWLALAAAMLPAILVHKLTGFPESIGNDFVLPIFLGVLVMVLAGFLMDRLRVGLKMFFISFAAGVVIAYAVILTAFLAEANRSGFNRTYSRFDFDQAERRIAWQLLCTSGGLYLSLPIVLLWRTAQITRANVRNSANRN